MYRGRGGLKKRAIQAGRRAKQAIPVEGKSPGWVDTSVEFSKKKPEELVKQYLPIIRRMAAEFVVRNPGALDVEDLASAGVMGLLGAISRFDPNREIKFRTFAEYRIRGAMLDEIRAMDWVPRSVRTRIEQISHVSAEFTKKAGRPPDQNELAEMLGLSVEELADSPSKEARVISLDEWVGDEDDPSSLKDVLPAPDQLDPLAACISNQMRDVLLAAIERLPERQGQIVRLYYFSGLTMKAIGAIRGLTESGICRVHADALSRLRTELEATGVEMQDRQSA